MLLVVAGSAWLLRGRVAFHWSALGHELRSVSILDVAAGVVLIYAGHSLRAVRWSALLSMPEKVPARKLLPAQFVGFTLAALLGRVTDLVRPWLISRRLRTPLATQLAVYSLERAFDLGAAAILFSLTLAFAPHNLPHHEAFARTGVLSLIATTGLAGFAVIIRYAGKRIAKTAERWLRPWSAGMAEKIAARLLDLQEGFRAIQSAGEFIWVLALSLLIWVGVALAYYESAHAFGNTPQLATFSLAATMLLLASGMGGSLLQLPIVGWFTQIAVFAGVLHQLFGVPLETATACGAVLLFVTTLCVVPTGLVVARIEGFALREVAQRAASAS